MFSDGSVVFLAITAFMAVAILLMSYANRPAARLRRKLNRTKRQIAYLTAQIDAARFERSARGDLDALRRERHRLEEDARRTRKTLHEEYGVVAPA